MGSAQTKYYVSNERTHLERLKEAIDEDFVVQPRLWATFTYRDAKKRSKSGLTAVGQARKDLLRWGFVVSGKEKAHIQPFVGVEDQDRVHIHAVISADKDLPLSVVGCWSSKHNTVEVQPYDKKQYGVIYAYGNHMPMDFGIICPRCKSSCKRKKCKYQIHGIEKKNHKRR